MILHIVCHAPSRAPLPVHAFFDKAKKWVVANYRFTMSYVRTWECETITISRPVGVAESGVAVMHYMRWGSDVMVPETIEDARGVITRAVKEARSLAKEALRLS